MRIKIDLPEYSQWDKQTGVIIDKRSYSRITNLIEYLIQLDSGYKVWIKSRNVIKFKLRLL